MAIRWYLRSFIRKAEPDRAIALCREYRRLTATDLAQATNLIGDGSDFGMTGRTCGVKESPHVILQTIHRGCSSGAKTHTFQ
jgi:hypothetical protein